MEEEEEAEEEEEEDDEEALDLDDDEEEEDEEEDEAPRRELGGGGGEICGRREGGNFVVIRNNDDDDDDGGREGFSRIERRCGDSKPSYTRSYNPFSPSQPQKDRIGDPDTTHHIYLSLRRAEGIILDELRKVGNGAVVSDFVSLCLECI